MQLPPFSEKAAAILSGRASLPFWALGAVACLAVAALAFFVGQASQTKRLQEQLRQITLEARGLSLDLEAERGRNQVLAGEAERVMQDLKMLEAEINRLREKAGLPKIPLLPAKNPQAPRGGGADHLELGELLLSIQSQMTSFAAEIEPVAEALGNPLSDEVPVPVGVPLHSATYITSGFGVRASPFGDAYEFHNGLDFSASYGAPVYATASGVVEEAGWKGPYGLAVVINHNFGYRTLYGHLSAISVAAGERVEQGNLIGQVGSTGRSTGAHLHYTVFRYGVAVDPSPYAGVSAVP